MHRKKSKENIEIKMVKGEYVVIKIESFPGVRCILRDKPGAVNSTKDMPCPLPPVSSGVPARHRVTSPEEECARFSANFRDYK